MSEGARYLRSYYAATANWQPAFPVLTGSVAADVAIVGGGYTGINAAIELAGRGFSVAIVEARHVGWGCSGRNGGQVIGGITAYERLLRHLGRDDARILWQAGVEGLDIVYGRVRRFEIDCDLKMGYFDAAWNERQMRDLLRHHETQQSLGYPHAQHVIGPDRLSTVIGTDAYVGGVIDAGSGHLHPLNLCLGEASAAAAMGVRIFERSPVVALKPGATAEIRTASGVVRAKHAVLAGNAYLEGVARRLRQYFLPVGSYLIATEPLTPKLAAEILPMDCAVCDQNTLLDYYRLSADRRLLFGGRCNHTGREPGDIKGTLLPRLLKVFRQLRGVRVDYEWGGTVAFAPKRVPQFGRLHGNVLYAQGYSGHGIVASHVAGRLLAEAIAGQAGGFDVLSRVKHWRFPGGKWFATPALALGMTYYRLRDLL
ncbi:MAG TPA: FAD-binding oxidoreductase [Gammaproteobacteria bacterium]